VPSLPQSGVVESIFHHFRTFLNGASEPPRVGFGVKVIQAARSVPAENQEDRMPGFTFKLEQEDGTPADPPALHTAVPNWEVGETIPLGRDRTLRVVEIRAATAEENPVLVVEPAER
jgi:hypothetical protein